MNAFAACTGSTQEMCQPPCEFVEGVCVPPQTALSQPLSDVDVDRISEVMTLFSDAHTNNEMRNALQGLNSGLNAYVRDVVRRNSARAQTGQTWQSVARDILSTTLNDLQNIMCGICLQEFDEAPVFVVECNFPVTIDRPQQTRTLTPYHLDCMNDFRGSRQFEGHRCPACLPGSGAQHPAGHLAPRTTRPAMSVRERFDRHLNLLNLADGGAVGLPMAGRSPLRQNMQPYIYVDNTRRRIYTSCALLAAIIFFIASQAQYSLHPSSATRIHRVPDEVLPRMGDGVIDAPPIPGFLPIDPMPSFLSTPLEPRVPVHVSHPRPLASPSPRLNASPSPRLRR